MNNTLFKEKEDCLPGTTCQFGDGASTLQKKVLRITSRNENTMVKILVYRNFITEYNHYNCRVGNVSHRQQQVRY